MASTATRYSGLMCDELVPLGWAVEVEAEPSRFIDFGNLVLDRRARPGASAPRTTGTPRSSSSGATTAVTSSATRTNSGSSSTAWRRARRCCSRSPSTARLGRGERDHPQAGRRVRQRHRVDWEQMSKYPGVLSGDRLHPTEHRAPGARRHGRLGARPGHARRGRVSEVAAHRRLGGRPGIELAGIPTGGGSSGGGTATTVRPTTTTAGDDGSTTDAPRQAVEAAGGGGATTVPGTTAAPVTTAPPTRRTSPPAPRTDRATADCAAGHGAPDRQHRPPSHHRRRPADGAAPTPADDH